MSISPTLYSTRCQLSHFDNSDVFWLFKLFNEESVLKYMEGIRLFADSIDSTKRFVNNMNHQTQIGNAYFWVIRLKKIPIGFIGIYDFMYKPNLFYAVCVEQRGRGFATECVKTVTNYIHNNYGISLTAEAGINNISSVSVLRNSGYYYDSENRLFISSVLLNLPCLGTT